MKRFFLHRSDYLRVALFIFWALCVVSLYWFVHVQGIPWRAWPQVIRREVLEAGSWGPVLMLVLYLTQTVIPFPTAAMTAVAGVVYGPLWGSLLVCLGLSLSGAVSFWLGRFFGHHFIHVHGSQRMRKYDELLRQEGFITVLSMRLLMFPFDIVGLGCGMSQMSFSEYMWGTILGIIPGAVTFAVMGRAFTNPRAWILFGLLLILSLGAAWLVQHSKWMRSRQAKGPLPSLFD